MAGPGSRESTFCSEKFSNEFLTCPLCLDCYKQPKVLPCQHTFCLPCLKGYVRVLGPDSSYLPCPVCKERTLIPHNDPSKFRNNHHITCLLEYYYTEKSKQEAVEEQPSSSTPCASSSSSNKEAVCTACGESGSLTSYCGDCCLWLCHICSKAHERVPATAGHYLRTMDLVDKECKEMAAVGEKAVMEYTIVNNENCTHVQKMLADLPGMVERVVAQVDKASEAAHQVVREKRECIVQQLNSFQQERQESLKLKLDIINTRNRDLTKIQELLTAVKITDDGYCNQVAVKNIDKELKTVTAPLGGISDFVLDSCSVHFNPFTPHLKDIERMEIGKLVFTKGKSYVPQVFHDHQLKPVKAVCLTEREYISGLAVTKLADKLVVSNNESVFIFKPDSSAPKRFLHQQSNYIFNKPWGIAFSETDQEIYVSEAGEYEGNGSVTTFTMDGKVKSIFACGMTLPRGLAAHNGFVFVCDQIDKCVYIFNKWGKIHKVLKKTPDGRFLFVGPVFVSVGLSGNFAVTDNFSCVKIFDKHCNLLYEYWPAFLESQLWGVLVLRDDSTVVCDWVNGLHQISSDFQTTGLVAVEGSTLKEPSAIAAIENGTIIYVGSCYGEVYHVI